MDEYWVKLHSGMLFNNVWKFYPNAWRVFECLLLLCYPKDGSWSGGRKQLAKICNLNENTVYRGMLRLQKEGMLRVEPNNKYTVFYICKWNEYQVKANNNVTTTEQQRNNNVTTTEHSINMKELDKEIEKDTTRAHTTEFDSFWNEYPSKKGKKEALRAWQRSKDKPTIESVVASIQRQKQSAQWRRGFVPNPATWINQGRWDDEDETPLHTYKPEELDFRTAAEKARSKA